MKRAQLAIEYLSIVAFSIGFFLVLIYGLVLISSAKQSESALVELDDYAKSLQKEFILAATLEDGYQKTILIPDQINGLDYSLTLLNSTREEMLLEFTLEGSPYYYRIPEVQGTVTKGTLLLQKQQGVLLLS